MFSAGEDVSLSEEESTSTPEDEDDVSSFADSPPITFRH
jgi:hypothetical protein